MNIPMPNEEEKDQVVNIILSQGLKRPASLRACLRELYQALGIRNIFLGVTDCLYLALVCSVLLGALWLKAEHRFVCSGLFMLSPFLYVALYLLSLWKETQTGTFEIKMACKYTLRHLTAFRMLCFSSVSIICNILLSAVVFLNTGGMAFIRLLTVSLCALFLYAVCMLMLLIHSHNPWTHTALPALWTAGNLLLSSLMGPGMEAFLTNVPIAAVIIFLIVTISVYLQEIRIYLFKHDKGAGSYVNC